MDARTESGVRVIELHIDITAPIDRVWKALVKETGKWWPRDFYTNPDARNFIIEPKLGGRMYEDWGKGEGLIWATVTGVKAPTMLELAGVSSPAWGGPNTHYHAFRLVATNEGTRVDFTDAIHGRVSDELAKSLHDGWVMLFEEALKQHCEKRAKPLRKKVRKD